MEFETKVAIVLDEGLAGWQKANVAAFLTSGLAGTQPSLVGKPYVDASGRAYLPMCRQPIMVFAADADALKRAHARALSRNVDRLAIFTRDLFTTPHDEANRAAVAVVTTDDLDLVGLALHADRKTVDKVTDRLRPHP